MKYEHAKVPAVGSRITVKDGRLVVPDEPIVPFIEGDGTGPDIWRASAARLRCRRGKGLWRTAKDPVDGGLRRREGVQVARLWLPDETVEAFREFLVGIKGPLTTPIGGGIRSLNVALRQLLDLYVCLRPVRWFKGVPSPVKHPEKVDMVIFRENTEDIYAGIEWEAGSDGVRKVMDFLKAEFPKLAEKIRFPDIDRARASSPSRSKAPSASSLRPSSTPSRTAAAA